MWRGLDPTNVTSLWAKLLGFPEALTWGPLWTAHSHWYCFGKAEPLGRHKHDGKEAFWLCHSKAVQLTLPAKIAESERASAPWKKHSAMGSERKCRRVWGYSTEGYVCVLARAKELREPNETNRTSLTWIQPFTMRWLLSFGWDPFHLCGFNGMLIGFCQEIVHSIASAVRYLFGLFSLLPISAFHSLSLQKSALY